MIESTLQIVIVCDRCDAQIETENVLGEARRPDVNLFEAQAIAEARVDGWSFDENDDRAACPDCTKDTEAENGE